MLANTKFVAFDLEFTSLVPSHDDARWGVDVHIACAATMTSEDTTPSVWFEKKDTISEYMGPEVLQQLINYLAYMASSGYTVVTWGGVAADFRMLAKEVPHMRETILDLCMNSVDIPFASGSCTGIMMGLGAAASALGFASKMPSVNVPTLWTVNKPAVLEHVSTDTFMTVMVTRSALLSRQLTWITSKGHPRTWCPIQFSSVRECLQMAMPSTPFEMQDKMNPKVLSRWMF